MQQRCLLVALLFFSLMAQTPSFAGTPKNRNCRTALRSKLTSLAAACLVTTLPACNAARDYYEKMARNLNLDPDDRTFARQELAESYEDEAQDRLDELEDLRNNESAAIAKIAEVRAALAEAAVQLHRQKSSEERHPDDGFGLKKTWPFHHEVERLVNSDLPFVQGNLLVYMAGTILGLLHDIPFGWQVFTRIDLSERLADLAEIEAQTRDIEVGLNLRRDAEQVYDPNFVLKLKYSLPCPDDDTLALYRKSIAEGELPGSWADVEPSVNERVFFYPKTEVSTMNRVWFDFRKRVSEYGQTSQPTVFSRPALELRQEGNRAIVRVSAPLFIPSGISQELTDALWVGIARPGFSFFVESLEVNDDRMDERMDEALRAAER